MKKIKKFLSTKMAMDIPVMLYNKKENPPEPKKPSKTRRSIVAIDKFETSKYALQGYYKPISKSLDSFQYIKSKEDEQVNN